jgi:hypothetical protein
MHYDQRNRKSLTRAIEEQVYSLCQSSVRPRIRALQSIKVGPRMDLPKFRANSFDGFSIDGRL